jgi:Tol biopolymer transport system component
MFKVFVIIILVAFPASPMVATQAPPADSPSDFAGGRTQPLQLTDDADSEQYPLPSPNGSVVVFNQEEGDIINHVYTVPTDGSKVKTDISPGSDTYWFPDYNPAGTYLCYSSGVDDEAAWEIVKYEIGGSETVLTNNESNDLDSWMPRWSHGGGDIAYIRRDWDAYPNDDELVVIADDGSDERSVHTFSGTIFGIDWNQSGTELCVAADDGSSGELYKFLPNAGATPTQVGSDTNVKDCHWSADGSKILYLVLDGGNRIVKSINPDGTGETTLFDKDTFSIYISHVAWTADSTGVIFHTIVAPPEIYLTDTFVSITPVSFGQIKAGFH